MRIILYVVTVVFSALSIQEAVSPQFHFIVGIMVYIVAACTLALSCYYFVQDISFVIKNKIKPTIEANPFTNRVARDYRYRTVLFTCSSLVINLFYAVSNGIFGIIHHSEWFGTLSAYYIVLSIMRFLVISSERKVSKLAKTKELRLKELAVYRNCGALLLFLTIAFARSVVLMVCDNEGKRYSGTLIFAVAAYTFYKVIVAVINVVRVRKQKSLMLSTVRNIGYVDALVSVLSLQTAMFASFGEQESVNTRIMNGITGAVVCVMILTLGIYMIVSASEEIKSIIE